MRIPIDSCRAPEILVYEIPWEFHGNDLASDLKLSLAFFNKLMLPGTEN